MKLDFFEINNMILIKKGNRFLCFKNAIGNNIFAFTSLKQLLHMIKNNYNRFSFIKLSYGNVNATITDCILSIKCSKLNDIINYLPKNYPELFI